MSIIENIRKELKANVDPKSQQNFQRFFKEKIKYYGIKSATVAKIAKTYWKKVKELTKKDFFILCDSLLRSDFWEEAFIVSNWAPKLIKNYTIEDLKIFEKWIDKYINNWAKCDSFCNHTIGDFIEKFPECIEDIKSWTLSANRWMKRAAAVSLILPARRGKYLSDIFEIADTLIMDNDDMVQKGYGWLLKEASRLHQDEVLNYVIKNKKIMPRTALRYAIELMPKNLKAKAMKKD